MTSDSYSTSSHPLYYLLIEQHLLPTLELNDSDLCLFDSKVYKNFKKNIHTLIELSELSVVYQDSAHLLLSFMPAAQHILLETMQTILEIEYRYRLNQYLLHGYSFYIIHSTEFAHMTGLQAVKTMSDRAMWSLQTNTICIDSNLQNNPDFMVDISVLNHLYHSQHQTTQAQINMVTYQNYVTIEKNDSKLDTLLNLDNKTKKSKISHAGSSAISQQHGTTPFESDNAQALASKTESDKPSINLIFYNNTKQYDFHELLNRYYRDNYDTNVEDIVLEIGSSTIDSAPADAMLYHAMSYNTIKRYISYLPTLTQTYAHRLHQMCSRVLEDGSVAILENSRQHMYKLLSYILIGYATYCRKQSHIPYVVIYHGDWLTNKILNSLIQLCTTASQQQPFTIIVVYNTAPPYLKQIEIPYQTYTATYEINKSVILQSVPKPRIAVIQKYLDSIIRFNARQYHNLLAILMADHISPYKEAMSEVPHSIRSFYKLLLLQPTLLRTMVYTISLLGHYIYIDYAVKFFKRFGYSVSAIDNSLDTLIKLGIIQNNGRCQLYNAESADFFRTHCIKFYPQLVEQVASYYYQQWREHRLPLSLNLLSVMSSCKLQHYSKEIVIELMHYYALKRDLHALNRLSEIATETLQQWNTSPNGLQTSQLLLQYINIHLMIYDTTKSKQQQPMDTSCSDEIGTTIEYGYYLLAVARYLYYHRQTEQALRSITKSIIVFQDSTNEIGLTRSYIDASCYLMSSGKLQDAEHYINIAVEIAPDNLPAMDYFRLLGIQTSIAFAFGDYSQVLHLSQRHKKEAGYQDWILFVQFLVGRAQFELGDYEQAIKEFIRGINISRVNSNMVASELFTIWLARTNAYCNNFDRAEKLLVAVAAKPEMLLVTAELYLLQSKYEEGITYIKRYTDVGADRTRTMYEIPDFRNGYIGCSSDHGVMMSRMAQAIHGYLVSKLGMYSVAQKTLQHLIHIENISHNDPYLSLYYLYYSEVTQDNATPENIKLRLLLIGRALKCMQECSRMISDNHDRMKYIKRNRWNKKIVRYAEQYNLL